MILKRIYLIFTLSFLASLSIFSQSPEPKVDEKGKFVYAGPEGTFIINPQYDEAQPFIDGKAIVRKGNNYGLIDANNNTVIPLKYNLVSLTPAGVYMVCRL